MHLEVTKRFTLVSDQNMTDARMRGRKRHLI